MVGFGIRNTEGFIILTFAIVWTTVQSLAQNFQADTLAPAFDVELAVSPLQCESSECYASTNVKLNISATIRDTKYQDPSNIYKWTTKSGPIQVSNQSVSEISYTFTKESGKDFFKVDVVHPPTNGTGSAEYNFFVESPVVIADPVGKLFLEFGELLNINLTYTGTSPFNYCYKICSKYDILPCDFCFHTETSETTIPIVQYLHWVGNYTLYFDISNHLNHETRKYTIKINDTVRKSTLPIAPIVSSIVAVCILITGVALHLRFRGSSYQTEIANFDFIREYEEDWEEELSFIQRVKYLFFRDDDQDDSSETRRLISRTPGNTTVSSAVG